MQQRGDCHHRFRRGVRRPAPSTRDLARAYGVRVAFEALAWGRFVDDYRRSWRIVERADHPRIGSLPGQLSTSCPEATIPAGIEQIPGEKIFYVQLADAPCTEHGRAVLEPALPAVPGEGAWDLAAFAQPRAVRGIFRPAVAGGFQRHIPADRRRPDRGPRPPLAGLAAGPGGAAAGRRPESGSSRRRRSGQTAADTESGRDRLRRDQGGGHQ